MPGLTNKDKEYIEGLIRPLSEKVDGLSQLREEFNKKIEAQNATIKTLVSRIEKLESEAIVRQRVTEQLVIACDDNQQYSRRESIRIHGIEAKEGETNDDVLKVVEDCSKKVNVNFSRADIACCHRAGKPRETDGKKTQSIIVKYKHWEARARMYKARPKFGSANRAKFLIGTHLTKRRVTLLSLAREKIKGYQGVAFVFSDINCSLGLMHDNGNIIFFSSESQLDSILAKLTVVAST